MMMAAPPRRGDAAETSRAFVTLEPAVGGIRIDSGDLDALSREARMILDAADRVQTRIFASGDLDEWSIRRLVEAGAPVDAFGVGTELVTSRDAPALSMVYKLVELDGEGRFKRSPGKRTYPSPKQIHRRTDADGLFARDLVTLADERAEGEPLLIPYMKGGRPARALPTLEEIRGRCRDQLARLPEALRPLDAAARHPIAYSDRLEEESDRLGAR